MGEIFSSLKGIKNNVRIGFTVRENTKIVDLNCSVYQKLKLIIGKRDFVAVKQVRRKFEDNL